MSAGLLLLVTVRRRHLKAVRSNATGGLKRRGARLLLGRRRVGRKGQELLDAAGGVRHLVRLPGNRLDGEHQALLRRKNRRLTSSRTRLRRFFIVRRFMGRPPVP